MSTALHSQHSDISLTVARFATAFPTGPAIGTVETTNWSTFTEQLQQRRQGVKDGPGFIPATFRPELDGSVRRIKGNLVGRTAIVLDIETNKQTGEVPPPLGETITRIQTLGWSAAAYTSHSHTQSAPRYRVVIPLSGEIPVNLPAVEVVASLLRLDGVYDTSKAGANSLFYLPSCNLMESALHDLQITNGASIESVWMTERAGALLAADKAQLDRQRGKDMETASRRHEDRMRQGIADPGRSLIEQIRGKLDLASELTSHGYVHKGADRYLHPQSTTGIPGVYVTTGDDGVERAYSHHASDPLGKDNLPSWCRAKAVDAVDVLIILDHGGDLKAGLRALATRFGIETRSALSRQEPPPPTSEQDYGAVYHANGAAHSYLDDPAQDKVAEQEPPINDEPPDDDRAEQPQPDPPPDEPKSTKRGEQHGKLLVLGVDDIDTATARTYLLKGLLSPAELSIWVGPPKCGKSFLLLYVAYLLSLGRSVFGRRVKVTKVLYVAAEGEAGIANRIRALRNTYGHSANFHFIAQPADLLHADGHQDDLIEAAQAYGAELIVLDTLSRLMAGGDENSPQDMGTFVRNLGEVRHQTGAHIAVVHHGTKSSDGSNPRGHSSLTGADDALIEVQKLTDGSHVATVVHAKDDADGMRWGFALDVVELGLDDDGDPITTLTVNESMEPPPKAEKAPTLSKTEHIALTILDAAMKAEAILATVGDDHAERSVVPVSVWRQRFYSEAKPGENQETKRQAFKRAVDGLISKGCVVSRHDYIWRPDRGP